MEQSRTVRTLADLPHGAFAKADPSGDDLFYAQPRMVAHIDEGAIAAVTALYQEVIPPGADVLDLMSSRYSHLPEGHAGHVVGHGMNADELAANPQLDDWFVRNLNEEPTLRGQADGAFGAVVCCVSVQYLERPGAVFAEAARVLRPGGRFVITFSNRCFPTKAVAIWGALGPAERCAYVAMAMEEAGLATEARQVIAPGGLSEGGPGDPLWAVIGER